MSQTSRETQKENALILRNETRKGRNTKVRVYNLINDLVDSALMYDQIAVSGSTGLTKNSIVDVNYLTGITSTLSSGASNEVGLDIITGNSYTATTTSHFIHWSGTTAASIYLPTIPKDRQQIVISDAKGIALTNNITIHGNGKVINGSATALIDSNYGTLMFIYNGINWIGSGFIS